MSEMLTIRIDGQECTCEKGEYLYDVARRNNIAIPVLCRSDAFADHRACCRICIVEVEIRGRRKVVTSCVYPVEQECDVYTKSEKILEERAVILSLLAHRAHWGEEAAPTQHDLPLLTPQEAAVYDALRRDRHQPKVRLEQERIGYGWLCARLENLYTP